MPTDNSISKVEFHFRPMPPGRWVNRWVVAGISVALMAAVAALWLYLYVKSLEKPYTELRGYRVPTQQSVDRYLRQDDHRARFAQMLDYFDRRGVGEVVEPQSLLRQGTDWLDIGEPAFAIAPESLWPTMVATLTLLRDELVPSIGPVEVLSAYRTDNYNRKTGGSRSSKHRDFCGLDLVPQSNISRKELVEELKALHARLGPASHMGLGFSSNLRFHIDTCGYRTW